MASRTPSPQESSSPYTEDPGIMATDNVEVSAQGMTLLQFFDGVSSYINDKNKVDWSTPPDPVVAVGTNHVVHASNNGMAIYDKAGTLLWGPHPIRNLFQDHLPKNDSCALRDDSDPTVEWDHKNNRFVVSQFTINPPVHQCIALLKTSDPTGDWWACIPALFPDTGVLLSILKTANRSTRHTFVSHPSRQWKTLPRPTFLHSPFSAQM